MARPESTLNLNHIPTPQIVLDRLQRIISVPRGARALDPCCGTGMALASISGDATTYGIEIEGNRSADAATRLDHVLHCPMQESRISNQSFGLMLLNPPYDHSTAGRLEKVFLDRCTNYLTHNGLLVLIVPIGMVKTLEPRLRTDYTVKAYWRFPDGWFDGPNLAFRQTVIIARRDFIRSGYNPPLGAEPLELPATFGGERMTVPLTAPPSIFLSGEPSEEALAVLLEGSPVSRSPVALVDVDSGRPLVSLKQGHISMLLAAGVMSGVYGNGPKLHVSKGTVVRTSNVDRDFTMDDKGRVSMVEKRTDSFAVAVRALRPNGTIVDLNAPATIVQGGEGESDE